MAACRYYYQVGDGVTFSTTYNFTTYVDVSQGAACPSSVLEQGKKRFCSAMHGMTNGRPAVMRLGLSSGGAV